MKNKKKVWTSLILSLILVMSLSASAYAGGGYVEITSMTQSGDTFWAQIEYSYDVEIYDDYGTFVVGGCGYKSFPITSSPQWVSLDVSSCSPGYYDVYVTVDYYGGSYEDLETGVYIN